MCPSNPNYMAILFGSFGGDFKPEIEPSTKRAMPILRVVLVDVKNYLAKGEGILPTPFSKPLKKQGNC
jgi:hypothetical protein